MRVPASQCPGLGPVLAYLIALLHLFLRAQLERNDCCRRGRLAAGRFNNSIPGCASNIRVWFLAASSANIRINRPRAKNGSYWNLDLIFASRVAAERWRMSNLLHAMKNLRRRAALRTIGGGKCELVCLPWPYRLSRSRLAQQAWRNTVRGQK